MHRAAKIPISIVEYVHPWRCLLVSSGLMILVGMASCAVEDSDRNPQSRVHAVRFIATAYSLKGVTASGGDVHEGIVAADPAILPLGTHIRVGGAGSYSGEYLVKDTGRKIDGRHIDIFIRNHAEAKRFGKRRVTVEVVRYPDKERKH